MRPLLILSAAYLAAATPALAQVTVDLHALQALPDHPESKRLPHPAAPLPVARNVVPPKPPQPSPPGETASPSQTATVQAQQPAMPETVPATPDLNPIAPVVPVNAPPPPPVAANAATTAEATPVGLRLTFAPDQSELSPDSNTSIKQLAAAAPPGDDTTFNVLAYAPGKPDDPSTARRVSLSRAMAVRGALVADGVPSARIFVRALGEKYGDGPPDRVDISVTGPNSASAR